MTPVHPMMMCLSSATSFLPTSVVLQLSGQVIETEAHCAAIHHSPGGKVKKGLSPVVENKKADGCLGKAKKGGSSGRCDSGPTNNILASKAGRLKAQSKAVVPTRSLPDRPSWNIHPAGLPTPQCSKEQIEAQHKAKLKELEELLCIARLAWEDIVQLNLMEEVEDDLPICLSTKTQKQPYMDVEGDSDEDEGFDLRDAENGSDLDRSESDKATKAKTKVSVQLCI
jgi:hypothetical protein